MSELSTMTLSIVVPCYNEADNAPKVEAELIPVVQRLAGCTPVEVIFVDDGSADDTRVRFEELSRRHCSDTLAVRVVPHDRNRGLGAALRTGFSAASGQIIVTTDSDATYRFSEIPALLDRLVDGVDLVTASPYHPEGAVAGVPPSRLVLSKGSSFLYRRLVSARIHTYTALFRAYRRQVLETTPFRSTGFLAGTEILVNAMQAGYTAAEYPTVLHSRVIGVSKARLFRTIRAHLAFQFRILLARAGFVRAPWADTAPGARAARVRGAVSTGSTTASAGG
jgi:dolichol-phosphate mannosyltransferase